MAGKTKKTFQQPEEKAVLQKKTKKKQGGKTQNKKRRKNKRKNKQTNEKLPVLPISVVLPLRATMTSPGRKASPLMAFSTAGTSTRNRTGSPCDMIILANPITWWEAIFPGVCVQSGRSAAAKMYIYVIPFRHCGK